jgi:methionyl-tRNA formyltransferase
MRVMFFGTPAFAAPTLSALIQSRHEVVAAVTQPDRARGRGQKLTHSPVKALALAHNVPVLQPESLRTTAALDELRHFRPDIGVVAAYGKILPQLLLEIPALGLINVHASLLPRWRGAAPIHRAILAGDAATGVTIMRVVFALDAGPMLIRDVIPIEPNISSDALEVRLADVGASLLVETIDQIETGRVTETAQDESLVTYARKIERADGPIDWSRPAQDIHNQIRGLHPLPMASTTFRGQRLIVRASRVGLSTAPSLAPGTIAGVSSEGISVATGAGTVDLTELQLESRKPQTAREFASGARLEAGERFA